MEELEDEDFRYESSSDSLLSLDRRPAESGVRFDRWLSFVELSCSPKPSLLKPFLTNNSSCKLRLFFRIFLSMVPLSIFYLNFVESLSPSLNFCLVLFLRLSVSSSSSNWDFWGLLLLNRNLFFDLTPGVDISCSDWLLATLSFSKPPELGLPGLYVILPVEVSRDLALIGSLINLKYLIYSIRQNGLSISI